MKRGFVEPAQVTTQIRAKWLDIQRYFDALLPVEVVSTRLVKAPSASRVVSGITGVELSCGADDAAIGVEHQGVAAVEDGERREGVKACVERTERGSIGVEKMVDAAMEMIVEVLEATAGGGEGLARIVAKDCGGAGGDQFLTATESRCECGFETGGEVVEALGLAVQQGCHARLGAADGQSR